MTTTMMINPLGGFFTCCPLPWHVDHQEQQREGLETVSSLLYVFFSLFLVFLLTTNDYFTDALPLPPLPSTHDKQWVTSNHHHHHHYTTNREMMNGTTANCPVNDDNGGAQYGSILSSKYVFFLFLVSFFSFFFAFYYYFTNNYLLIDTTPHLSLSVCKLG